MSMPGHEENVHSSPSGEYQSDGLTEQSDSDSQGSTSTMCISTIKFNVWAQRNNLVFLESKWTDKEFTDFMNQRKYPAYVKGKEFITSLQYMLSTHEIDLMELDDVDEWRSSLGTDKVETEDRYAIQAHSQHLTSLWISMLHKIENPGNQATYRAPIDMLLELAFQLRPRAGHLYRKEMELALPGEPEVIIADGIATKALPKPWNKYTSKFQKWNFSWNYSHDALSAITLVYEAKVKELMKGQRQVQMGLLSAQMQRRALCMMDGPVFGALLDDGLLRLYVSVWQKDQLAVRPVCDPLLLDGLGSFLESYFILCRIADFQAQWLEKEFKRWYDERSSQKEKLKESKIWRKERRTKSKKDSQAGGDTDVQDAEEEAEGEPRDDLEKAGLDDDEEVKCFKMAAARDPFPKDGYFLTRKRLYVLIKLPKEKQPPRKQLISEWVKHTNACGGECMHAYSPEYDDDFRGDDDQVQ